MYDFFYFIKEKFYFRPFFMIKHEKAPHRLRIGAGEPAQMCRLSGRRDLLQIHHDGIYAVYYGKHQQKGPGVVENPTKKPYFQFE